MCIGVRAKTCPRCGKCGSNHAQYKDTGTKWIQCDSIRQSRRGSPESCDKMIYQDDPVGKEGDCAACTLIETYEQRKLADELTPKEQRAEHMKALSEKLRLDVLQKKKDVWGDRK